MEYELSSRDLKHYPHFDAPLPIHEIESLVSDPIRVAKNTFYPLMLFHEEWQPYRTPATGRPDKKSRPIRYASRRDAYIFSHYRRILSERYEARLEEMDISDCPIAYRQISKAAGRGGKCNIDFAKDAFDEIEKLGDCVAIALDIKSYFESLDHSFIKEVWCDLLGVKRLPPDHYAVFKNITRYHYVDQKEVYRRLGYLKPVQKGKHVIEGFTIPARNMPKQLCSPEKFQLKICGGDPSLPSLIQPNEHKGLGVPQGAPISDLIANFYLLQFDKVIKGYVTDRGGRYMRYSDDILLVLPGGDDVASESVKFVEEKIKNYGDNILIKDTKTCVVRYWRQGSRLQFQRVMGLQGANGFEYLGFRFDGRRVYVRESTISRLYRKVALAARAEAIQHVKANPDQDFDELVASFNYSLFSQRFCRVKRTEYTDDYRSWTFYSYLKRASQTFGERGAKILGQARGFRNFMRKRVSASIAKTVARRPSSGGKMTKPC